MKNAILIHGTGGTPNSYWFPYIKRELEALDYTVWAPQVPYSERPQLRTSLPFFLENGSYNGSTVIIAHSSGCPTALSIVENIEVRIDKAILVAGFYQPIDDEGYSEQILQKEYDWGKIRDNVRKAILINSDNDPWGCDDTQGKAAAENLGAKFILNKGEGHMGSDSYDQPYLEFPLLVDCLTEK